ncbi:MAG TPA: hypothetical protein VN692_03980 [Steroidobacteraceae bacterium]|nr:hypothetical protein [Steroidobacteraceae bacterium]
MGSRAKRKDTATLGLTLSADPVRAAFQRRSLEALGRIAAEASIESLTDALGAATDVGTLARVLGDSEVVGSAITKLEPLAPLIARNAEHRLELLEAAGSTLTADEVGALLDITRQAVDKRRRTHGLLGLRQGGDWRYPRCQFDEAQHEVVDGMPRFLRAFAETGPWMILDVLLAPDETLGGRSPLEVLRTEGWSESLQRLARIEQGDGFG